MPIKNLKLTAIIISTGLYLTSCQSIGQEQKLTNKEKSETDLINVNSNKATEKFMVDKSIVKKAFLEYLPKVSGGRKLNTYWKTSDGEGFKILLGDINGDNLIDGIVDYSLDPLSDDNGGGGNAISEIPGLIVFVNTGKNLISVDHTEKFGGNFGARNELKNINKGVIFLEGLDYAEDDPRCCPSIKTTTKIVLRNNKLTELIQKPVSTTQFTPDEAVSYLNKSLEQAKAAIQQKGYSFSDVDDDWYVFKKIVNGEIYKFSMIIKDGKVASIGTNERYTNYSKVLQNIKDAGFIFNQGAQIEYPSGESIEFYKPPSKAIASSMISFDKQSQYSCFIGCPLDLKKGTNLFGVTYGNYSK